jgi:2-dehydropantoate 2-reductase
MRIAVMGTGGVGGYFGGRLAASGADVSFIARGAHLAAIRANGLRLRSEAGDAHVANARATDRPAEIGPVDVVLFAPKLYDCESAAEAARPLVGPDTAVISVLNGVDAVDRMIPILGREHVCGGVAYISAAIAEPGVIAHYGRNAQLAFGELDGRPSPRLQGFLAACEKAGVDAKLRDDIQRWIWSKFAMLAPFAAATAMTRQPIGPIRSDPDGRRLLADAVAEVAAVAKARGVDLGGDAVERTMKAIDAVPASMKASMLFDLERGNRLEVEWLSGAVWRLGREAGIDTPVHRVAYAALKPFAAGAPKPA